MISPNQKTSLLIRQQLPEFIRDDSNYANFVSFLEAYYEWLETSQSANTSNTIATSTGQGTTYASKNLLNYIDVDNTLDEFVNYFINDFLPYIPEDALTDKRKLLKISKEFYQSKGTEKSFKFLFRALYNVEAQTFNTGDVVLRASAGKWIVPKSLRIDSTDYTWLLTSGLRVFGETSKSFCTIDYVAVRGTKIEIFITNTQRGFSSGETIKVVDNTGKDVYFYNEEVYIQNQGIEIPLGAVTLSDRIVGSISKITINPNYKGVYYNPGDPVIAYNGLNPTIANPIGFLGEVGSVSTGGLTSILVGEPSNGYRVSPDATVTFSGGGGVAAAGQVSLIDDSKLTFVTQVTSNTLGAMANVQLGNSTIAQTYTNFVTTANTNSRLLDVLTFKSYAVGPVAALLITSPGTNYSSTPNIGIQSLYTTDYGTDDFSYLGMLKPIQIVNGGVGYGNSNTISIIGGLGFGAYANLSVNAAGSIISANYVYSSGNTTQNYPLGGLGYDNQYIPTVNISSTTGTGANLIIPGIMSVGATAAPTTDTIGSVLTINILNAGEDYISTPNISLKIADVAVKNVSVTYTLTAGDLIYQGTDPIKTYYAYFDSSTKLITASPPSSANDVYQLRTYEYIGSYDPALPLKVNKTVNGNTYYLIMTPQTVLTDSTGNPTSRKIYGDGFARATASFYGGIFTGEGKYLNDDGHISSQGIVLESMDYNNFTYILSTQRAISSYRDLILNLVHPSGTRLIGKNILPSGNTFNTGVTDYYQKGNTLAYVAGSAAYATLYVNTSTTNISNNIIKFTNVISGNIGNTILANDIVQFTATNNTRAYSVITQVDWSNNQIYMQDNVYLTFANVAYGSANANSNVINISTLTGQYDGNFTNKTKYDSIFFIGDTVSFNGGSYYTITKVFSNGAFSISSNSVGPLANTRITVNKNANTQSVMIYGDVGLYNYPELTTEDGYSLLTEIGEYILIG